MSRPALEHRLVSSPAPKTIVSFHAHPDDEALFTGGSLAQAAAAGHRVVLVLATRGEAGLSDGQGGGGLGDRRWREVEASAMALGVSRLVCLGYADSGLDAGAAGASGVPFVQADVEEAAGRLAAILTEEHADVLTGYDAAGGYGHPDHRQVHLVARRAASLAGTPTLLEATVDRRRIIPALRLLRVLSRVLPLPWIPDGRELFAAPELITHSIDVRQHLGAKRAALRAHSSQATGGPRTVDLLLRLPAPLSRLVLGREWFCRVP
ncbi:MAG TPA: PIG-L family deacetylase [Propionibacteriaceae bacterium]|nr:PIG-L family deacetylase [Propionibacteriaceae bacterium]